MIVYDHRSDIRNGTDIRRETSAFLELIADRAASHDDLITTLIAFGMYESAVADALCPERDEPHPLLLRLRTVAEWLGAATLASMDRDRAGVTRATQHAASAWRACGEIDSTPLSLKVPEGYAYYSLYPESYAEAVTTWAHQRRPGRVVALGLRSIGTSLSAIVTGALRRTGVTTQSWTLRPHGHPFERRVEIADPLAAMLQLTDSTVLIVDEGPGLSGSSLTGTAAALSTLGLADDRIVFVPSWSPDPSMFVSSAATARWRAHEAIVPAFEGVRRTLDAEGIVSADAREISAGAWRAALALAQPWPAVHPQHERRKFLCGSRVARFAGLGTYGAATARRAAALADAGWSPPPVALRHGFLTTSWLQGTQARQSDASAAFSSRAASYIAWLRCHAPSESNGVARLESLSEMLLTNTREALGPEWLAAAESLIAGASTFSEPATAVDGRLQPHEWLATPTGGWMKTDALDHHRDHFLPGCTDAAWDVAGFLVEWDLAAQDRSAFVDEYATRSSDRLIRVRLPFFTATYAAFRAGYCAVAARALAGTEDGARFDVLIERYRDALRVTLANARSAVPSAG